MPRSPRYLALAGQPTAPTGINAGTPLAQGLVAAWPNGGASFMFDAVAGRNLTLGFPGVTGGSNFRNSRFGNTPFLDFGNGNVNANSTNTVLGLAGATELTFSIWVCPTTANQSNTGIIGRWDGNGAMLYVNPELRIYINGTNIAAGSSALPVAGQWVHLAGTWSGTVQRAQLYVNGVQVADAALAQTSVTLGSGSPFNVGSYNGSSGTFNGGIAIPALWRRRLSPSQIRQLYEEPWCLFELQRVAFALTASGGGTTLAIDAVIQAQLADTLTLTADTALTPDDCMHAQLADNVTLSTNNDTALSTDGAAQAQLADTLTLTTVSPLAVDAAVHAQLADNLGLTVDALLSVDAATQAQLADNITLSTNNDITLAIDSAAHAQLADSPSLTSAQALAIADAVQAQIADNLTLSANNDVLLSVSAATHTQLADNLTINTASWLIIADAVHTQLADNVALTGGVIVAQGGFLVYLRRRRR